MYRCYALDLRGHGDSEWSRQMEYSLEAHAGDVHAFVTALELVDAVIVGMSLGGGTAVRYAIDHPPRALVVVDTGPQTNRVGGRAIIDFMRAPAELDSIDEFIERSMAFNPRRDPRLLRRSLLHNLMRLPDGKWTWKYDRRHFGRLDDAAQDRARQAAWANVESITCPVLLVRGAESPVLSRESADAFAARLVDARVVEISGAGHTVQGDNPRDLSAALHAFLHEVGI
jgi:pimeloyl-ACP methyl ester carboxylesterase